jgi:hypothetical protein
MRAAAIGLGLTGLLALTAGPANAQTAPLINPFDAAAMRGFDWAGVEHNPVWAAARTAGPRDQPGGEKGFYPFRATKMIKTTVDNVSADLALLVAKDGSGRHQIIMTVITVGAGDCGFVRDQMIQAYGPAAASRQSSSQATVAGFLMTFGDDVGQWRAGATTLTQACGTIVAGPRTIYTITIDLEPATTAMALVPPIPMTCQGLDLGVPPSAAPNAPTLTLDPRVESVRGPDGKLIAMLRVSDARFDFDLPAGRIIEIDRKSGAYIDRATQPPQERHGVCKTVAAAG